MKNAISYYVTGLILTFCRAGLARAKLIKNSDCKLGHFTTINVLSCVLKWSSLHNIDHFSITKIDDIANWLYFSKSKEPAKIKFLNFMTWGQCYKTFSVRNLRIFVISLSVGSWQAFPT